MLGPVVPLEPEDFPEAHTHETPVRPDKGFPSISEALIFPISRVAGVRVSDQAADSAIFSPACSRVAAGPRRKVPNREPTLSIRLTWDSGRRSEEAYCV